MNDCSGLSVIFQCFGFFFTFTCIYLIDNRTFCHKSSNVLHSVFACTCIFFLCYRIGFLESSDLLANLFLTSAFHYVRLQYFKFLKLSFKVIIFLAVVG